MSVLTGLWGGFKALSIVGKIGSLGGSLGALSFINPIFGAVSAVINWIVWAVKKFVEGTLSFLTNPTETFAVVVLCLISLAFGLKWGIAWDAHLVKQARGELESVRVEMRGHDNADATRAKAAMDARIEAERAAAKPVPLLSDPGVGSDASPPRDVAAVKPKRVRKPKTKVRRRDKKSSVPSFQDHQQRGWGP